MNIGIFWHFWLLFVLVPPFDIFKYFKLYWIITQHHTIYIYLEEYGLISDKIHRISDISDTRGIYQIYLTKMLWYQTYQTYQTSFHCCLELKVFCPQELKEAAIRAVKLSNPTRIQFQSVSNRIIQPNSWAAASMFRSIGEDAGLGKRIQKVKSVLEHVGLYLGLAVYTAVGAKVATGSTCRYPGHCRCFNWWRTLQRWTPCTPTRHCWSPGGRWGGWQG